jgi:hypothetical protein
MAKKKVDEPLLKLGDRVKVRYSSFGPARVVELRGPLGPGGKQVYRVRVPWKPKPVFIELTADLLELLPSDGKK